MERESDLLLAVPSIHVTVAVIIPLYIPTCGSTALLPPDSVALLSGAFQHYNHYISDIL